PRGEVLRTPGLPRRIVLMKHILALGILFLATAIAAQAPTPKREDVPKYLEMLKKSEKASDRALAAEMLGRRGAVNIKDVEGAIEPLKKALQNDKEVQVRKAAVLALGIISPEPASATVPLMIEALMDKDYGLRMASMQALVGYGPEAIQ